MKKEQSLSQHQGGVHFRRAEGALFLPACRRKMTSTRACGKPCKIETQSANIHVTEREAKNLEFAGQNDPLCYAINQYWSDVAKLLIVRGAKVLAGACFKGTWNWSSFYINVQHSEISTMVKTATTTPRALLSTLQVARVTWMWPSFFGQGPGDKRECHGFVGRRILHDSALCQ